MHKHGTVRTYEQNTLALFAAIVLAAGWCGFKIGARSPTTRSSAAASVSFQDDDGTDLMVPSVVVVTAMHSELERWIDRLPLGQTLGTELWWNGTLGILGMVTGEGMRSAAISATALGYDNRFDVRSSYWMFAGIAGVDPAAGSIGSAFWAEAIIHADAGNMFDAREIPASFNGTTILPSNRDLPFGAPPPTDAEVKSQGGIVYNISSLANYAYNVTRSIVLPDDASLLAIRAAYEEGTPARMPPSVRLGNVVSSNLFWAGTFMTQWARRWHDYWLDGRGRGVFATTAMEDTSIACALDTLTKAGRANASRLLVLRTASDYSMPPPEQDLVEWFYSDGHYAMEQALEAAFAVGSAVASDLATWPNSPKISPL